MNPFKNVEVNKPPKITVAIGLWISFPGRSPFNANGINATPTICAKRQHIDRVQTVKGTLYHGLTQSHSLSPQMRIVADQQHTVSGSDTKQGNETDNRRDTDLAGSKP